jgi:hypothetical protein
VTIYKIPRGDHATFVSGKAEWQMSDSTVKYFKVGGFQIRCDEDKMISDYRERIKDRIRDSILKFKKREIDYINLINDISGNISALDNLDRSVERALISLSAELETIHYMKAPKAHHSSMITEVEKFENFIDKI